MSGGRVHWVWVVVASAASFATGAIGTGALMVITEGRRAEEKAPAQHAPASTPAPPPVAKAEARPKVTYQHFQTIRDGMRRAEVEKLMGWPGAVVESFDGGLHENVEWRNPDRSGLRVSFSQGVSRSKAQIGLEP